MVKQYPHTITITTYPSGTRDEDGNPLQGTPTTTTATKCRYEPNQKAAMIVKEDGTEVVYSGTVFMPLSSLHISPGATAEVKNGDQVLSNGKVLRFSKGQINMRLWL